MYGESFVAYTVGKSIAPSTPLSRGDIAYYSVSPALPNGLNLDPKTGVISGTPKAPSQKTSYTITGHKDTGSVSTKLEIAVTLLGMATAAELNVRYSTVVDQCNDGKPGYACSGVMVRAIGGAFQDANDAKPWELDSLEIEKQSASFSYIRKDILFSPAALYDNQGLVFKSINQMKSGDPNSAYSVLCMYPADGATGPDTYMGCGRPVTFNGNGDPSSCAEIGVNTATDWLMTQQYLNRPCSFSARDVEGFKQNILAQNSKFISYFGIDFPFDSVLPPGYNEFILTTWGPENKVMPALEAFYYRAGGKVGADDFSSADSQASLSRAQAYQKAYFHETGYYIPILRLHRDRNTAFEFVATDQT